MKPTIPWLALLVLSTVASPAAVAGEADEALRLIREGHYEEAQELLESGDQDEPGSVRLLIELAERRGDWESKQALAQKLFDMYLAGRLRGPEELSQAAFGAWRLDRWEEANEIYMEASQEEGAPLSLYVDWGNLFLEKFNPGEAESIFQDALRAPESSQGLNRWTRAEAYLGLARALRDQSKPGGSAMVEKALQADPDNLAVLAYRVRLLLNEENWSEAGELLEQGFKKDPGYLPLLELNAALALLQGKEEEFSSARAKLSAINPRDANLYELLGDLSVSRRRLEESVDYYDQAVKINPRQWTALASKGINLLRMGREEEGIEILEQAYQNDPYNIWTVNTLRLVDSFKHFVRFETDHFSVKLHEKEAAALRPYVEELLERCLATLEKRYDHVVTGKTVFEMYPDHEDFAVRTMGLPGLGALGATFGQVVAMDSPSARPRGEFHWASTLWHELAHVVTLSLSKGRVPRWFTEGLSMREERLAGPGWGDHLSLGFVQAFREDKLLPLNKLNSGFVRPGSGQQLAVSYYQAGWICDFLEQRHGIDKIRQMLVAYGEGLQTDEVFDEVLGETVEDFDTAFREEMTRVLAPLAKKLEQPKAVPKEEPALRLALAAKPENYFLNIAMGKLLLDKDRSEEAASYLENAIEIFPSFTGHGSPYPMLLDALIKLKQEDEANRLLKSWWSRDPRQADIAIRLAKAESSHGDKKDAATVLAEAMYTDPLAAAVHQELGDLLLEIARPAEAVREYGVLLSLSPVDAAGAHFRLAQALKQVGDREAARRQVLLSLEVAPGYEEAQKLLLELVRP